MTPMGHRSGTPRGICGATAGVSEWFFFEMADDIRIRASTLDDLPALTAIYNHYVVNTPITFDIEPFTVAQRMEWFETHGARGRHRLLVAEENGTVVGYAATGPFRAKRAYETSVETSIYCA